MKKLLILLIAAMFLVACSTENGEKDKEVEKEQQEDKTKADESKEEEEETEDELSEDGKLTEVGQVIKDKEMGATVELLEIIKTNDTIDLGPIKLTLDDIKIINMSDIKKSDFKSYLSQFTDKEEFDYIQINYTLENTVDENIEIFSPIEYVVLDTGEQIDVMMKDIALDPDNGGQFFGKVTKESGVFVIIENSDVEDINNIKLITGDVWKADGDKIADQVEKEYSIK